MKPALLICLLVVLGPSWSWAISPPPGCKLNSKRTWECEINALTDCNKILDLPYARNSFCPGAFNAIQTLTNSIKHVILKGKTKNVAITGSFIYYQTMPTDIESQTTTPCMLTVHPGNSSVVGGGKPVCKLISYASSIGQRGSSSLFNDSGNPVEAPKGFVSYFSRLLFPALYQGGDEELVNFKRGSSWDEKIRNLGSNGAKEFLNAIPGFSLTDLYVPNTAGSVDGYYGISSGGGSGWGAELGVENATWLQFGGGGGGGFTSYVNNFPLQSRVGSGGGGGINFADGYVRDGRSFNGLGLGAGTSSAERQVLYSYYNFTTPSGKESRTHTYNAEIVQSYRMELRRLKARMLSEFLAGNAVTFQGGGGGGGGHEYLEANGEEYVPHALSTQAGFKFSYALYIPSGRAVQKPVSSELYKALGEIYNNANKKANIACGGWYDYHCICTTSDKLVLQEVKRRFKNVPEWMKKSECPPKNNNSTVVY